MKRLLALLLGLLLATAFTACHGEGDGSSGPARVDYPVTIGDLVVEKAPARVVVLSESLADVVLALGSGFEVKLVGRSDECTQKELEVLPTVGTAADPSVESIAALQADLILTDTALSEPVAAALQEKKIQVMVQEPAATRTGFETLYANVGSVLLGGKSGYEAALKRAQKIFLSVDDIARLIPEDEKNVTACLVLDEKGTLATSESLSGALLEYAGAINVVAEENGAQLTAAELKTANPTYLFCRAGLKETVLADARFSALPAVAAGRVYEVDGDLLDRQGQTVLDLVIELARAMHPSVEDPTISRPPVSSSAASGPELEIPARVDTTSSRKEILVLQNRLIDLGYMQPPADGAYGYWTKETVKVFQERVKLEKTGIADEETMKKLFAADAPKQ